MSVINQVLQQLEQRRAAPAAAGAAGAAGGPPLAAVPTRRPQRLTVIVVLGLAAISVAAFGDWPQLLKPTRQAPAAIAPLPASGGNAAPVAVVDPPAQQPTPQPAPQPAATSSANPVPLAAAPRAVAPQSPVPSPQPPAPSPHTRPAPLPAAPAATAQPMVAATVALAPAAAAAAPRPAPELPTASEALPAPTPGVATRSVRPETPAQRAQALWRQAMEFARGGHRQLAIERATAALALDRGLQPARHLAAALLAETGRAGEAEALLRQDLGDQTPPSAVLLLARLSAERGDTPGALSLLDRHPPLRDADSEALRGALYARQGHATQARLAYEAALSQRPQQAAWWLGLAVALEAEQDAPHARQAFERARALGLAEPELAAYAEARLRALN